MAPARRVALLADLHANLHALEAVLADAAERGAAPTLVAGDWTGYGAFPNEVVERLRPLLARSVVGDWDLEMLGDPRLLPETAPPLPAKVAALAWTAGVLATPVRVALEALPVERRLELGGRSVLVVHGSPAAVDERLDPDTEPARLRRLAGLAAADVVVCGHSHVPFVRREGCLFVNPGSVGRAADGDPRASYALFDPQTQEVELRRVAYDVEAAAAAVRRAGLPEPIAEMFRAGTGLRGLLGASGAGR